jgi:glycerophosphoryl diester phosphodiesterase
LNHLGWLTARPIAHRGLHEAAQGLIENSIGAARAAIAAGYGIECDVQAASDGGVVVFHDDELERLTGRSGEVNAFPTSALTAMELVGSQEKIPALADFLAEIGGRTPLVIELKSRFDGSLAAARRVAELLSGYDGPAVMESFDPEPIAFLRERGTELGIAHVPLGMVAEAAYDAEDWRFLSAL